MTTVVGVAALAALFVVFGVFVGKNAESHGCGDCPTQDDPGACGACHDQTAGVLTKGTHG